MSDAQDYHDEKNKATYDEMQTAMRDFHVRELPPAVQALAEKAFAEAKKATPDAVLETQIMDSRIAKNEREQWARRRIEHLKVQLAEAKELLALAKSPSEVRADGAWTNIGTRWESRRDALLASLAGRESE